MTLKCLNLLYKNATKIVSNLFCGCSWTLSQLFSTYIPLTLMCELNPYCWEPVTFNMLFYIQNAEKCNFRKSWKARWGDGKLCIMHLLCLRVWTDRTYAQAFLNDLQRYTRRVQILKSAVMFRHETGSPWRRRETWYEGKALGWVV